MIVCTRNNFYRRLATPLAIVLAPLALLLTGCGMATDPTSAATAPIAAQPQSTIQGRLMGGETPITGASVTLWRVNTDGSAATSMLTTPVTSGTGGTFSITGDYTSTGATCTSSTQVYIMATGGNPGLSAGTNNTAISLMAALGPCSALPSTSFITINEVTTVASVYALQQFLGVSEGTAGAEDIATSTLAQSATGMANAFAVVPALVNITTGTVNSTYGNATIPASKINSIANILVNCTNSSGPTSSTCQSLFSAVTPSGSLSPGDTLQAALYMAQNPALNVATLYAQSTPQAPFQTPLPLTSAPFDWSLAITYTADGMNLPNLLAADASGNIWVTNSKSSGGESLTELTPSTAPATGSPFLSGANVAFDGPQAVVPDTLGNIWVSAHSSSSSIGNRLVTFKPSNSSVTAHSGLPSGCDPYAAAIDGKDDVFFACPALGYLYEFPNQTSGTPSSTNLPTYLTSPSQLGLLGAATPTYSGSESYGMAIDTLGNVWVANTITNVDTNTITEYPASNYSTVANTFTTGSGPIGIAIDHANNVWSVNSGTLEEFAYSTSGYTTSTYTGAGLNSAGYLAVDGAGNLWVSNKSTSTISGTTYLTISQFNNSGLPITQGVTSIQPGGLANPTTITDASPRGITIDPSGNVWVAGCGLSTSCSSGTNSFLMEFLGVANPPVTPLASAIASNQLGCCSFTPVAPSGTAPTATAGNVSLQASTYALTQDNGTINFEVTRTGGFKGALSVKYTFTNGTANNGTDYSGTNGTLTWADGDSSIQTISVNWLHTSTYTGTKTFSVTLTCTSACPAAFSPYSSETVTVTDNLTPPSTHFAFNNASLNYYLGLPVDQYGGTGGLNGAQFAWQTVSSTQLAAGFSDPYFYLNASNQIVFTAPSTGATSSPGVGTNDTRSEMREQYNGTGSSSGSDWDSTIGGTLTATCAVNQTSVDTTEATIGQIHGQNNPFVLLEYQPTSSTQGNIVLSIVTTNTTNSGSNSYTIASGINLNSFFTYVIKLSGNQLTATVNGASTTTMPLTVDSSWTGSGNGLYFKFGAYSGAPNTGNPTGDQTQVTFSAFSITHP